MANADSRATTLAEDVWQPAQVYISDIIANQRKLTAILSILVYQLKPLPGWLIVLAGEGEDSRAIWRVIAEDWSMACDEVGIQSKYL